MDFGIGGSKDTEFDAWFVCGKDLEKKILYVCQGYHNEKLYSDRLTATDFSYTTKHDLGKEFECTAKFRYRQPDTKVKVIVGENNTVEVIYAEKVRAVTPGQSVVFYNGEVCLGGAIIDKVYMGEERLKV